MSCRVSEGVGVDSGVEACECWLGERADVGDKAGEGEAVTVNCSTYCVGPYVLSPTQSILRVCVPTESFAVSAPASTKFPDDAEHVPGGLMFHVPPAAQSST